MCVCVCLCVYVCAYACVCMCMCVHVCAHARACAKAFVNGWLSNGLLIPLFSQTPLQITINGVPVGICKHDIVQGFFFEIYPGR